MTQKLKEFIQFIQRYRVIRKFIIYFNYYLRKILSKNFFLAWIYNLFFYYNYNSELKCVTEGIFYYYKALKNNGTSKALLLRNVHRLEKGLTMRPLKPVFALNYIEETVESYKNILSFKDSFPDKQIYWAHDVLEQYFKISKKRHPLIKKNFEIFDALPKPFTGFRKEKFIPYARSDYQVNNITYEELFKLSLQRRSIRYFKQKKVPGTLIEKAIKVAKLAPSACNRQPFLYRVFDKKALVSKIASIPYGSSGYAHNIPLIVAVTGDMSNFFNERDRHITYIDASLSVMAFMYALETLGLSSTCINIPAFLPLEKKISKVLNLAPYEHTIMLLAVGFPDNSRLITYSEKKNTENIRSFNH